MGKKKPSKAAGNQGSLSHPVGDGRDLCAFVATADPSDPDSAVLISKRLGLEAGWLEEDPSRAKMDIKYGKAFCDLYGLFSAVAERWLGQRVTRYPRGFVGAESILLAERETVFQRIADFGERLQRKKRASTAGQAPRPGSRSITEADFDRISKEHNRVRKLLQDGHSLRKIATETNLSYRKVRRIANGISAADHVAHSATEDAQDYRINPERRVRGQRGHDEDGVIR